MSKLNPKARAVHAALAEPGTEAQVVERTGLVSKTVGPRLSDLVKEGLIEAVGRVENHRGRKVTLYAQVSPERVEEAKARAHGRNRRKELRTFPLQLRKRFVRELFKDQDLVEALVADEAADRAAIRARKAAREELRKRERRASELRQQEWTAANAQHPHLPFWRGWRELTQGADAARILKQMLERDRHLERIGVDPLVAPGYWSDGLRHTDDLLRVSGELHTALRDAFAEPREACPACGITPPESASDAEVVEGEIVDELLELATGTD